jgi:hypothetical protein
VDTGFRIRSREGETTLSGSQNPKDTMMSDNTGRQSATVYQFPAWPRARVEAQRKERERAETQSPSIAVSSAWYHAAALEEPQAS